MNDDLGYTAERLDHLGIVAEVCREIGVAPWLDAQAPDSQQAVSVGTATVAMVLNGLGFSNRRLYLVPQFFATKPVEPLLGPGITAEALNDDCLGRTLDWLYAHDVTRLFAGLALQARRIFGVELDAVHVDTTSFAVSGAYAQGESAVPPAAPLEASKETGDLEGQVITITYGYSRDHRADLKQWMLALATAQGSEIPLFLRPLDGNRADVVSLVATIEALHEQLRADAGEGEAEPFLYVADGGLYSAANMRRLNAAGIHWISRVPETSSEARAAIEAALARPADAWQASPDGQISWLRQPVTLPHGDERWLVVRTQAGEAPARQTLDRQLAREREQWEKQLWHLGNRSFACPADAQAALVHQTKRLPHWWTVQAQAVAHPRYSTRGRPRPETPVQRVDWQIEHTLTLHPEQVDQELRRRTCFLVGTNVLDSAALADEDLVTTYKAQGGVERGFRFLKDPLFLASSVFVKKPERIVALSFIMVLCLLVYRLAEHRLRTRLAQTGQTVPNQLNKPTATPTMRWVFELFEGIELLQIRSPTGVTCVVLRLQPVHQHILRLLGPTYLQIYKLPP